MTGMSGAAICISTDVIGRMLHVTPDLNFGKKQFSKSKINAQLSEDFESVADKIKRQQKKKTTVTSK